MMAQTFAATSKFRLSKKIYEKAPFSSQFSEAGAIIKNVPFLAVDDLRQQLEKFYGIKLETRGEAHITLLTPPEATSGYPSLNSFVPTSELITDTQNDVNNIRYSIDCIGEQKDSNGKRVFYLVVSSSDAFQYRVKIWGLAKSRGALDHIFDPANFYPHITIGFIKDDIHGVKKDKSSCIQGIELEQY